jgi:hypothetical protein
MTDKHKPAAPVSEHKPWCCSLSREFDPVMGRGPYPCDCQPAASPAPSQTIELDGLTPLKEL